MYHDQGLIPLKLHAFHEGVNVTLGLPFPRTSPDHGTAFEIAGKGIARPDSMIAAINLAVELARNNDRWQLTNDSFREKIPHRLQSRTAKHFRLSLELFPARGLRTDPARRHRFSLARDFSTNRAAACTGYDYGSMIYYYLLTIVVSNLVTPTEDEWQIAADIREGQINSFLTKPVNYLAYRFSIFLSGRLVYTAVTIPPILVILFLLPRLSRFSVRSDHLRLRVLSLLMAAIDPVFHHLQLWR